MKRLNPVVILVSQSVRESEEKLGGWAAFTVNIDLIVTPYRSQYFTDIPSKLSNQAECWLFWEVSNKMTWVRSANNNQPASSCASCREPLPGAGGHHPDQAERAHRGPAQSRRHRQHHHAGGHGLRNELLHGAVDTAQEIQTHHQHVLRVPARCSASHTRNFSSTSKRNMFTRIHTSIYIHVWAKSSAGWARDRGDKGPPSSCATGLFEEHFCTFRLVVPPPPFYRFCFLVISQMTLWSEGGVKVRWHLSALVPSLYKHAVCLERQEKRLYFSVWMWRWPRLFFDLGEGNQDLGQKEL